MEGCSTRISGNVGRFSKIDLPLTEIDLSQRRESGKQRDEERQWPSVWNQYISFHDLYVCRRPTTQIFVSGFESGQSVLVAAGGDGMRHKDRLFIRLPHLRSLAR